jgi:hypothetical protein
MNPEYRLFENTIIISLSFQHLCFVNFSAKLSTSPKTTLFKIKTNSLYKTSFKSCEAQCSVNGSKTLKHICEECFYFLSVYGFCFSIVKK